MFLLNLLFRSIPYGQSWCQSCCPAQMFQSILISCQVFQFNGDMIGYQWDNGLELWIRFFQFYKISSCRPLRSLSPMVRQRSISKKKARSQVRQDPGLEKTFLSNHHTTCLHWNLNLDPAEGKSDLADRGYPFATKVFCRWSYHFDAKFAPKCSKWIWKFVHQMPRFRVEFFANKMPYYQILPLSQGVFSVGTPAEKSRRQR